MGAIAFGHLACMLVVAGSALMGASMAPGLWAALAAAAWLVLRGWHRLRGARQGHWAGLALGSFTLTSLHGAGVAIVPALLPLCTGRTITLGAQADWIAQTLWLIGAGLAAHTGAMLLACAGLKVLRSCAQRALRPTSAARPGS